MSGEEDLEAGMDLFPCQPNDDDDDDQVVPDLSKMTFLRDEPELHVPRQTSTPMTRVQHVSHDSGYQSSPGMARVGPFSQMDTGDDEEVFRSGDEGDGNERDTDSESLDVSETVENIVDSGVQFDEEVLQGSSTRVDQDLGVATNTSDYAAESDAHVSAMRAEDSSSAATNTSDYVAESDAHVSAMRAEDSSSVAVAGAHRSLPLRAHASEPAFRTHPAQCYAGARPKVSQQGAQSIPVPQSHADSLAAVTKGVPLSPNTRTSLFNQLGHSYGTPPRAYPFHRMRGSAEGVLVDHYSRARHGLAPACVTEDMGAAVQRQQAEFDEGQQRLQEKNDLRDSHRPRHYSVVNPPNIAQLDVDPSHDLDDPPANGYLRPRQRSNSAPAVMTLQRAFGRELRRISDEFDEEHQPSARRTLTAKPQRRGSVLSYQQKRANRLSFPGAQGQEGGWWQHIVQWIPIPGYAGSTMSRHRTEPLGITDRVSEEEESSCSDELDGLGKSREDLDDDSESPDVQVQFSLDDDPYTGELQAEGSTNAGYQAPLNADDDAEGLYSGETTAKNTDNAGVKENRSSNHNSGL